MLWFNQSESKKHCKYFISDISHKFAHVQVELLPKHRTHFWHKNVSLTSDIWFVVCFFTSYCAHLWMFTSSCNEHCPSISGNESRIAWGKIVSQISKSSVSFQTKGTFLDSRKDTVYTWINRICFFSHFTHAKPRGFLASNSLKDLEEVVFPWPSLWPERDDRNVLQKRK